MKYKTKITLFWSILLIAIFAVGMNRAIHNAIERDAIIQAGIEYDNGNACGSDYDCEHNGTIRTYGENIGA